MIGVMARRMTSPVLVGRTEVVGQLQAALDDAREGEPRHVVIGGEAGVGKTRLLSKVRELAEAQGSRVLLGGCVSMGGAGLPFAPYTEILRSLVAQDGAPAVSALAGRAVADLSRLVPALSPDSVPPEQELWAQTRLYEALHDLLRRLSERNPLLLQLEDMHWADAGTLAATSYLLRAARGDAVTIVATFRSDEITRKHPLRPWLAEIARDADVERIDLEPLDLAALAALVRNILGEDLPGGELTEIHRRSDGNPFFAEELLCCRSDMGETLPASLKDVLLTRIDTLPDTTQRLLGVAAIGGREVEHDTLVTVAGGDEDAAAADLRQLVDEGLLLPVQALDGDDAYSFRHALLQEAVYDAMLPTERRRLHRAWAEELMKHDTSASQGAVHLVELAHHWREARNPRALAASVAAGDAAMAGYAFDIAVEEYEHGLLLWDPADATGDVGLDHVELLVRTARAVYLSSQYRRAVALCREAITELGDDADPARSSEIHGLLGRALYVTGDRLASVETYERALELAPPDSSISRIRALAGLAQSYMLFGWFARARPLCEEAVELARASGARQLEGHGLNTLAVTLAGVGESDAAVSAIDQALAIAEELDSADDIGRAHVNRGDVLLWVGYPERALESTRQGIARAIELGVETSYATYLRYNGVHLAYLVGAWDEAAELLADGDRSASATLGTKAYRAEYALGYLVGSGAPEAAGIYEEALRMRAGQPSAATYGPAFVAAAALAVFDGRPEDAAEVAFEGLAMLEDVQGWVGMDEMVRVAAWPVADLGLRASAAGDGPAYDTAHERMETLLRLARERRIGMGDPTGRLGDVMAAEEAQLDAERLRLEGAASATTWGAVSEHWTNLGRPYFAAYALWREAEAAETAGDRDAALTALREAHDVVTRLGARPLASQLVTLARKMRVRLGAVDSPEGEAPPAAFGLTKREREVLELVAAGRTNRQIAQELFISESTAGVHVSNILGKLGVSRRTEAARVALDQGLVGAPD